MLNFGVPDGHFLTQACTCLLALSRVDFAFGVTVPYCMFSIRSAIEHSKLKQPDCDTSALDVAKHDVNVGREHMHPTSWISFGAANATS